MTRSPGRAGRFSSVSYPYGAARGLPLPQPVETIPVNSRGQSWSLNGLHNSFVAERANLGLPEKHLHDVRGTFVTKLCLAGATDAEIAGIVGWAPTGVGRIRRLYVDQARTVVAMGERLASSAVKPL